MGNTLSRILGDSTSGFRLNMAHRGFPMNASDFSPTRCCATSAIRYTVHIRSTLGQRPISEAFDVLQIRMAIIAGFIGLLYNHLMKLRIPVVIALLLAAVPVWAHHGV